LSEVALLLGKTPSFEHFGIEDRGTQEAAVDLALLDAVVKAECSEGGLARLCALLGILKRLFMLGTLLGGADAKLVELLVGFSQGSRQSLGKLKMVREGPGIITTLCGCGRLDGCGLAWLLIGERTMRKRTCESTGNSSSRASSLTRLPAFAGLTPERDVLGAGLRLMRPCEGEMAPSLKPERDEGR
jgi:hypothetical protein